MSDTEKEARKTLARKKANELGIEISDDAVLENAEITDVSIRFARGTFLTMAVGLDYEGAGQQSYGAQMVLNDYSDDLERRTGTEFGCEVIQRMVRVFDGEALGDAEGQNARAIHDRSRVYAIGHATKDEWHAHDRIKKNFDATV